MATELKCKELIKKRASVKAKLTQFIAYLNTTKTCEQLSDSQLVELDMRIKKLDDSYESFDRFQSELEVLTEEPAEQYAERELFERSYYKEIAAARELVDRHRSQRANEVQSEVGSNEYKTVVSHKHSNVRLPKINLSHFSGGYQNWLEFRDTYVSLIHSVTSIDNINKFHYLRASLHGSAALVIRSLDFKGDNYDAAWNLLCERYDNKQLLVNIHVQALFNIEKVHKESSVALRQVVDNTKKNLNALATLDQPVEHWDTLIIHIMAAKLDSLTSREWEEHRTQLTAPPALSDFITFLTNRCNLLETLEESKQHRANTDVSVNVKSKALVASTSNNNKPKTYNITCPLCNKGHYVFNCEGFRSLPVEERVLKAKEFKVCMNCLRPGHNDSKCKLSHCKYCQVKHNTLLHVHTEPKTTTEHVSFSANDRPELNESEHVFLSTVRVKVRDSEGKLHTVRALLDNGSTSNYISKELSFKLKLPTRAIRSTVSMLENHESNITRSCSLKLESCDGSYSTDLQCSLLSEITSSIPQTYVDVADLPIPSGIVLADPSYSEPSSIDILLGAKLFWSVLGSNRILFGKDDPFLVETKLGWLLVGSLYQPSSAKPVCFFLTEKQTDTDLTKFWELDTISPKHNFTTDENTCEALFNETTKRNEDGRFIVTIPLKETPESLGDSFQMAKRRFLSLERRLDRDGLLKERYVTFMEEYEALGHMNETLPSSSLPSYYLPHHAVLRESSTTTKLRVVFDASAATTSGKSFNDIQLVGPRIQDDLFSILLRFRQHKYVVSADIEKMYRQILVDDTQRQLQLILWRSDPSKPLKIYSLKTVTYGTSSAPFLSTRCLLQLSQESNDEQTREAIARDFYVDDFLSGSGSVTDTVVLCRNVTDTLKNAQFHLRKWQSNNEEILKAVGEGPLKDCVDLSEHELSKTLGLNWRCAQDSLTFRIDISLPKVVTKRHILSAIAQIFDPLGLVMPCIVQAKILMQKLWVNQCSWDDPLTGDILTSWKYFVLTLPYLNDVSIPRWVLCDAAATFDFHIFTDASERAYGACLYVRSVAGDGSVSVHLLASKSKVAPIKATTIPRLELCGALLGSRLCTKVLDALTKKPNRCVFWCDSMIVMGWLSSSSCSLRPFVRNRISEIQESSNAASWRYVPSKENPADLVSRGLGADLIMNSSLWWSGPSFLKQDESYWPNAPNSGKQSQLPETIPSTSFIACSNSLPDNPCNQIDTLIKKKSSFSKLQRVIACVLRFIHNCKKENTNLHGNLTSAELDSASVLLLRRSQQDCFPDEYERLKEGKALPKKSRLSSLSPFFDSGLIRVGGRLVNSFYDYGVKHPIVICSKHPVTRLLFKMFHLRLLHAPPQLLLATIKQTYWPLGGRNLSKHVVHTCLKCVRLKGETVQPIMGNLPKERLHLEYPFLETGTDYAGPILIADRKGRGCKLVKAYICLFVCLASKALHLELVSDLTKEAFMAALNRFIGRRGKPKVIFSDNGTTFVGTFNELSNLLKQDFAVDMTEAQLNFSFIPAYTPHFGGLWESAVKSVKYHLRRTLGLTHLTYEEMSSCLIGIEAILNSRPLTPLSSDPSDLTFLSPAHFLIGRSLTSLPYPQLKIERISSLQRFQRIEVLKQHFWNRFSNEYVSSLQQRTKWRSSKGTLDVGTLVVIQDKSLPPLMWLLGRIVQVLPGRDGIARVADIKTRKGVLRRAFNTICPLPSQDLEDINSSTPGVHVGDKTVASSV